MSSPANGFEIHSQAFEGPLDLLLDLIERRKLHINDISLSEIADDYLSFIERLEDFPTKDAAHFLVVASTLVLIKSRSLLPWLSLSDEEEASVADLEERLKLLARTKALAAAVGERFGTTPSFYREIDFAKTPVFSPGSRLDGTVIREIMREIVANFPAKTALPQVVVRKAVSMEEMMESLTERIKRALSVSFRDFSKNGNGDKVKVVIGFLAILELVKRGIISVRQNESFEDIEIEGAEVDVPRYY